MSDSSPELVTAAAEGAAAAVAAVADQQAEQERAEQIEAAAADAAMGAEIAASEAAGAAETAEFAANVAVSAEVQAEAAEELAGSVAGVSVQTHEEFTAYRTENDARWAALESKLNEIAAVNAAKVSETPQEVTVNAPASESSPAGDTGEKPTVKRHRFGR